MAKPRGAPIWGRRRPRPSEVSRDRSASKPGPRNAGDGFAIADCGQRPLDDPSLGDLSLDSPSRWANRKRSACERKAPLRGPWPSVRNGRARHAHWRAGVHIAFRHPSMGIQGGSQRQQGMRRTRPKRRRETMEHNPNRFDPQSVPMGEAAAGGCASACAGAVDCAGRCGRLTFREPFRRVPGAEAAHSSLVRPPDDSRPTRCRGATSSESAD